MPTSALPAATATISDDEADRPTAADDSDADIGEGLTGDHLDEDCGDDEDTGAAPGNATEAGSGRHRRWPRLAPHRLALIFSLTIAVVLSALIGWLAVRAHHAQQAAELRASFLQAGRQGAVNLTTIDWQHADADVQRILAGATGAFHDDFSQRSQPFIDVVKKVQSVSTGTVTVAGIESSTDNDAQVLVAVKVQTSTIDAPESSRAWRMKISVEKIGDDVKVSNVEFVP